MRLYHSLVALDHYKTPIIPIFLFSSKIYAKKKFSKIISSRKCHKSFAINANFSFINDLRLYSFRVFFLFFIVLQQIIADFSDVLVVN